MSASFFFYDLETSGFGPRTARIMQFGGQRTDMNLKPIGKPVNALIKLTPDVLPSPDAILITGITPQKTMAEGLSEAEFLKYFYAEIAKPETIFVGFNSVRFDDGFMQFLNYRNFHDAYEWRWKSRSSRWDLLDVVRMTRALRPDGIEWPFAPDGKPANRLEYLAQVNKLDHSNAHDALSDVQATISLARLLKQKQPKLFSWLLKNRDKRSVARLVNAGEPFVYTSGRYSGEYLHTTVATLLAEQTERDAALAYNLRIDPTPFAKMSVDEFTETMRYNKDPEAVRSPVKELKYNRCPAIAPLNVIRDSASQKRIKLDMPTIFANLEKLETCRDELVRKVMQAQKVLDEEREQPQTTLIDNPLTVDERLYDGDFFTDSDKYAMRAVRTSKPNEINSLADSLKDERLKHLLPLYKARNYPKDLSQEERAAWDEFCSKKLLDGGDNSQLAKYFSRLQELNKGKLSTQQKYLLEELKLYGESIVPADADV